MEHIAKHTARYNACITYSTYNPYNTRSIYSTYTTCDIFNTYNTFSTHNTFSIRTSGASHTTHTDHYGTWMQDKCACSLPRWPIINNSELPRCYSLRINATVWTCTSYSHGLLFQRIRASGAGTYPVHWWVVSICSLRRYVPSWNSFFSPMFLNEVHGCSR